MRKLANIGNQVLAARRKEIQKLLSSTDLDASHKEAVWARKLEEDPLLEEVRDAEEDPANP